MKKKPKPCSTEQKRAPWPFLTHNGRPLLPAKKFNPKDWPDAPY